MKKKVIIAWRISVLESIEEIREFEILVFLLGYSQPDKGVYIALKIRINLWLKLGKYSMLSSNSIIYKDVESYKLLQSLPPKILGNQANYNGK